MPDSRSTAPSRLATLRHAFAHRFDDPQGVVFAQAPGRVNLLGDHTDYNDGYVLPMTIDRAVGWGLRRRRDRSVVVHSVDFAADFTFELGESAAPDAPAWSRYVYGVIHELHARDPLPGGLEGVVHGDVPLGGGLSSSAALEVATLVSVQQLFGFALPPVEAIELCQHVEHRYAGVQCGIMDQFVSRLGQADHALFLDCRDLRYRHIAVPLNDLRVVIINSGRARTLAGSKYNERRAECQQAVEGLQKFSPRVRSLRDVTQALLDTHAGELPAVARDRARHVLGENQRVLDAAECLAAGNAERFGELMNASHESLRDLYAVSCEELDALVDIARDTPGVLGARMTGAGFGGCTVNLVSRDAVADLVQRVRNEYPRRCSLEAEALVVEHSLEAGGMTD